MKPGYRPIDLVELKRPNGLYIWINPLHVITVAEKKKGGCLVTTSQSFSFDVEDSAEYVAAMLATHKGDVTE